METNFHLSIFIIKVCEIYLPYTFKKTFTVYLPNKCDSSVQKQVQRGFLEKIVFLEIAVL